MDATLIRLVAHTMTIGVLLASIASLLVAHGRPLYWRHWRWLVATLYLYAFWFLFLLVSVKSAALLSREHLTLILGALELCAASVGWVWWARTVRKSFRVSWRHDARLPASE